MKGEIGLFTSHRKGGWGYIQKRGGETGVGGSLRFKYLQSR